ncbi:hypothetical protein [Undibacterium sp. SXout20W]|uniref:hypothetical protein n=1 Tax=Undibacterium sp. SXout20W TaxID=3413051 RepID=UPI003BF0A111
MGEAVRKIEVRYVQETPLDFCLDLWVRFCRRDDSSLGWRGRSALLESDAYADPDQLYERREMQAAEAMDAMIGSLKTHHGWAIRKRCGQAMLWRFPQLIFADVLAEAENILTEQMKKNLATRNYFN